MMWFAVFASLYLLCISIWVYKQPQSGFAWTSSLFGSAFPFQTLLILALLSFWQWQEASWVLVLNFFTAGLLLKPVVIFFTRKDAFDTELQKAFPLSSPPPFRPRFLELFLLHNWLPRPTKKIQVANRDGEKLDIDIYAVTPEAPCIVQIYGGGFSQGGPHQLANYNHFLNSLGYSVVCISYRFIPEHQWPSQLEDVLDIYKKLAESPQEFGLTTQEFIFSGRSAGGHLALAAAFRLQDPRVRGVISFYPLVDFEMFYTDGREGDILDSPNRAVKLLGAAPGQNPAIYKDINPLTFANKNSPPVLFFHGDRDSVVPLRQSKTLLSGLKSAGTPCCFVKLPYDTHGFDVNLHSMGGQKCTYAIRHFLKFLNKRSFW